MSEQKIVKQFSEKMYKKIQLRHNRYAPLGWKTMDLKRLISLLENELSELKEAKGKHKADEAIDIANYAMFIYEITKK